MYLSRVELDLTRRAAMQALVAPQKLHGAVESAFAGERRRRLWRLDRLGGKLYLLLLSEDQPDLAGIAAQFGPAGGTGLAENTRLCAAFAAHHTGQRLAVPADGQPHQKLPRPQGCAVPRHGAGALQRW